MEVVATNLKPVETFAIDSDDFALRDKGGGVFFVDDFEDTGTLAFFGEHEQHLHLAAAVEALCVDDGAASVRVEVDAVADGFVFVGDDEELH